jgi:hypothetical protein
LWELAVFHVFLERRRRWQRSGQKFSDFNTAPFQVFFLMAFWPVNSIALSVPPNNC